MKKVFVDGSAGTTGLRIRERLEKRTDIELITLSEELRKDTASRKNAINSADFVFLCLPDSAAIEAAELCENDSTVIIDASTAHRTADDWTYGFPELKGQRERLIASKRIANPGCHASGFIALIAPLTDCGIIKSDSRLSCFSITGYSGGGKKIFPLRVSTGFRRTTSIFPKWQRSADLKSLPYSPPSLRHFIRAWRFACLFRLPNWAYS